MVTASIPYTRLRDTNGAGDSVVHLYDERDVDRVGLAGSSHCETKRRNSHAGEQVRRLAIFQCDQRPLGLADVFPCLNPLRKTPRNYCRQFHLRMARSNSLPNAKRGAKRLPVCLALSPSAHKMWLSAHRRRAPHARCDYFSFVSKPGGVIRIPPDLIELHLPYTPGGCGLQ
jgi:hypothetical protein